MNPLQRAATFRKASYFGAIVVLFTVSMFWRGLLPVPGASAAAPLAWLNAHTIQSRAKELEVWDANPEESAADLSGSAVRLALTGSRGLVVTGLWLSAIDKQKRNDFHMFEQRVRAVTKLQPNFITPWIFQSWNITYNVSVEMQGSGDMYYYIVRGIQLLAEGERRNQRSPDMRYQIAFYYQNKFGVSDTVEALRCLFDLSCIPPSDRNPDRLMKGGAVDPRAFLEFCQRHPHLVRRLRGDETVNLDKRAREKLRAPTPEDVVRFLRDNYQDLPSRYRKTATGDWTDELAEPDPDRVFPVLPTKFDEGPDEIDPTVPTPTDVVERIGYFTAFKAARAWYAYSLLLLPPPLRDDDGLPIPAPTTKPGTFDHDPKKHRVPRSPMMILFRQGAPRAQSYAAEQEQKEGWFDEEGWRVEGWFGPDAPVVGAGREWSLIEWQRAASVWAKHGAEYGLRIDEPRLSNLLRLAGQYNPLAADPTPEQLDDKEFRARYYATLTSGFYNSYRTTTNFPFFLASAETEARRETVNARKALFAADRARKLGEPDRSIRLFKDGLDRWRGVLAARPEFQRLERVEEETCEMEMGYMRLLVQHDQRVRDRANELAKAVNAVVPFVPAPFPDATPQWPTANREELKWFVVENVGGAPFSSPFVGTLTPRGEPWVREEVREQIRVKQGVARGNKPPQPPPGMMPPGMVPPGGGPPGAPGTAVPLPLPPSPPKP